MHSSSRRTPMDRPDALQILVDLRRKEADDAARALAERQQQASQAQQQLRALEQYLEDYRVGLQQRCEHGGFSAATWANYQRFIAMLERAIDEQRNVLQHWENQVEAGRQAWQQCQRRLKSVDTLVERRAHESEQRAARREQKLNDEFAARQARLQRAARQSSTANTTSTLP